MLKQMTWSTMIMDQMEHDQVRQQLGDHLLQDEMVARPKLLSQSLFLVVIANVLLKVLQLKENWLAELQKIESMSVLFQQVFQDSLTYSKKSSDTLSIS